jgi:hypothetical protein
MGVGACLCALARPAAFGGCISHARARHVPPVAFAIARGNSPAKWPHGPGRRLALAMRRPPDCAPAQRSGVSRGPVLPGGGSYFPLLRIFWIIFRCGG